MSGAYILALIGLPILLLNLWGLRLMHRYLRRIIPGTRKDGTPQEPRLYVEGTPQPLHSPLRAPLTGRPCVAWRLSVKCHRELTNAVMHRYDRYSEGEFLLRCGERSVPVHLLPGQHSTLPVQTLPDYAPPWVMPLEQPSVEFTLRVLNEAAIAPEGHGLSKTQLQCAKEAALAEVDRLDLHLEGESIAEIRVTETIIDTAREWVCEGPRSEAGGTWTITALSTSLNFDATPPPVKLSPKECLARSRQQAIRQGLIPVVIMNTLLLPPIVIAIISAYF